MAIASENMEGDYLCFVEEKDDPLANYFASDVTFPISKPHLLNNLS